MLGNVPWLRYNRHHHWLWILRRSFPSTKQATTVDSCFLAGLIVVANLFEFEVILSLWIFIFGIILVEVSWLTYVFLDWRTRHIRLFSDGRLDYEYGILFRKGISVSMRFGSVRYLYRDRIGTWLDCADILLPFDAGTLEDISDFRLFWDIAQGRV